MDDRVQLETAVPPDVERRFFILAIAFSIGKLRFFVSGTINETEDRKHLLTKGGLLSFGI